MDTSNLGISFAFLAGLASFLSPCVFSLVPAYIGYLGGRTVASAQSGKAETWHAFSHGLAFVLGFSIIFILLGIATSAIGHLLFDMKDWLTRIGGVVVIIFGLHMTGIFRLRFLEYDLRPQSLPDRSKGYLSSIMMGVFFSAGWSPCVGPILGTILTLSLNGGSVVQGVTLLSAYSIGLAIPFLIASTQIGLVTKAIRRYGRATRMIEIGMGVLMVLVGIMLFTGRFQGLARFGTFFSAFDEIAMGRMLLIILVTLAVLAFVPAYLAYRKGRSFVEWYIFSFVLFPVAMVAVFFLKPKSSQAIISEEGEMTLADGQEAPPLPTSSS